MVQMIWPSSKSERADGGQDEGVPQLGHHPVARRSAATPSDHDDVHDGDASAGQPELANGQGRQRSTRRHRPRRSRPAHPRPAPSRFLTRNGSSTCSGPMKTSRLNIADTRVAQIHGVAPHEGHPLADLDASSGARRDRPPRDVGARRWPGPQRPRRGSSAASTTKAAPGPSPATVKPPIAGPMRRIMSGRSIPCSALAGAAGPRGSRSGTIAVEAGLKNASPRPTNAISATTCHSSITPATDRTPISADGRGAHQVGADHQPAPVVSIAEDPADQDEEDERQGPGQPDERERGRHVADLVDLPRQRDVKKPSPSCEMTDPAGQQREVALAQRLEDPDGAEATPDGRRERWHRSPAPLRNGWWAILDSNQ